MVFSESHSRKFKNIAICSWLWGIVFYICPVVSQTVWLEDTFTKPVKGLHWKSVTGNWKIDSGGMSIDTRAYDQLLASSYYLYNIQPFSIEVTLRGIRAGIYFSLDDTTTKALSQMIRFDESSVLTGYFNGAGEFTATSTFDSPKMPTDWTVLRIDVDPRASRYEVFVGGASIGVDDHLVYPSGYIGLQASDGLAEFKSVKISAVDRRKIPSRPRNGSKITFRHVGIVQVEGRNVVIYNPELKLWQTINPNAKVINQPPAKQKPRILLQASYQGRNYTINNNRILITNDTGFLIDSLVDWMIAPSSLAIDTRFTSPILDVVDAGANAVFQYTLDGKLLKSIDAEIIGGFKAPRGIALYGTHGLVVADYDRLVFYDLRIDTASVSVIPMSPTEIQINWLSQALLHSYVEFAADGGPRKSLNRVSVRPSGRRTAILRNLQPLTRYSFRVSPTLTTIPEDFAQSKTYRFTTSPIDSTSMVYTRLPVMCMVYRTISYRDRYPKRVYPQIPDGRTITDTELSLLRKAIVFNREFYFRNSSCRIVLDFDFYVVDDTLHLNEVGKSDPYWLSLSSRVTRDYETAVSHFGQKPEYYAGLVCPYAWVNSPPRRTSVLSDSSTKDTIDIRQAVGGGTYGVPAPWKYGTTTGFTSNPFQDSLSRQDWLITHEFHHQIDALMERSGYSGYYHADMPWKMPGRFGEDFDFNAHIIRNAPLNSWLTLKFGTLAQTKDADHDGVPDDDPSLPFDEKRLGGNSKLRDTDGDGLDDLREVLAGTSRGTDLNNKDTDGDGMQDAIDPEPLYPINPAIRKLASPADLESVPFATSQFNDLYAATFLRWDDQFLYFRAATDKPSNLLIQIDADNDGWFHGFDNFQIRIMHTEDSVWIADYYLRDCSSWTNPPKDRRDILLKSDLSVFSSTVFGKTSPGKKTYFVTVKIPRNDRYGLQLQKGKTMSVRFGLQSQPDLWVWDELFERNYMMQVELQ